MPEQAANHESKTLITRTINGIAISLLDQESMMCYLSSATVHVGHPLNTDCSAGGKGNQ